MEVSVTLHKTRNIFKFLSLDFKLSCRYKKLYKNSIQILYKWYPKIIRNIQKIKSKIVSITFDESIKSVDRKILQV